ncbi:MAG: MFS transporter [Myxococcota bacterium]|nr:MFS transporter [Myxococcota bacterium]
MSPLRALRTRIPDRNLWVVYATTWVLATAYGLALATTPLVLIARDFADGDIGATASWFGAGIVSFAVPSGWIIRRFGARRTLVVCILGYASMIALFPYLPELWQIGINRYFDGAFSVGVWVSCETLLLLRAPKEHKAFATSLYAIATGLGYFIGGGICWALVRVISLQQVFLIAACVAALSSLIALFRLDDDPPALHAEEERHGAANLREWIDLGWRIKTSSFATFCTGFFQSSVVIFLPAYLHYVKGVPENDTTLVTAVSAGGMLVISNVAGRIGDRRGHLFVLRGLAIVGVVVLLSFVPLTSFPVMLAAVLIGGGCLASIPPLSLALQGAIAKPTEYARSNSIFNVFFATGLLTGPFITGQVSETVGREAILYVFAALWIGMIVLSVIFRKDDPATRPRPVALPTELTPATTPPSA